VVTGFHGIWEAHQSPELHRVLNSADLWVADGIAPVWVARLRGLRNVKRTPVADIMQAFFRLAQQKGFASFFYGDTDETLAALRRRLEADYPGHRIAGMISPPFRPLVAGMTSPPFRPLAQEEDARYLEQINDSGAHVLWVGLGTPKQDRWIWERRLRLRVSVAVGVGAPSRFRPEHRSAVPAVDWRRGVRVALAVGLEAAQVVAAGSRRGAAARDGGRPWAYFRRCRKTVRS
jgi:N-acetylglucosaminyldiphosphoundecaprenol N-acetyl-beta-D-mannosaminyltransferase